jgi:hypothetical protein
MPGPYAEAVKKRREGGDESRIGMRLPPQAIRYTIRGVPPEVDRVLRHEAARRKQSLNRVIVDALTTAAAGERRRAGFADLVGRWTPDPAFDAILASPRQIDWEKWK